MARERPIDWVSTCTVWSLGFLVLAAITLITLVAIYLPWTWDKVKDCDDAVVPVAAANPAGGAINAVTASKGGVREITNADLPLWITTDGVWKVVEDLHCTISGATGTACIRVDGANGFVDFQGHTMTGLMDSRLVLINGNARFDLYNGVMRMPSQSQNLWNRAIQYQFGAKGTVENFEVHNAFRGYYSLDGDVTFRNIVYRGQLVEAAYDFPNVGSASGVLAFSIKTLAVENADIRFEEVGASNPAIGFGIVQDYGAVSNACGDFSWSNVYSEGVIPVDVHCARDGTGINITSVLNNPLGSAVQIGLRPPAEHATNCVFDGLDVSLTDYAGQNGGDGIISMATNNVKIRGMTATGHTADWESCITSDCSQTAFVSSALLKLQPANRPTGANGRHVIPANLVLDISDFELNPLTPNRAAIIAEPQAYAWFGTDDTKIQTTLSNGVVNTADNGFGMFLDQRCNSHAVRDVEFNGGHYGIYMRDENTKSTLTANTVTDACVGVHIGSDVTGLSLKQNRFVDNNVAVDASSDYLDVNNVIDGIGGHMCNNAPPVPLTATDAATNAGAKRSVTHIRKPLQRDPYRENLE